jgi:two-component sensor histidine kinase/CheY-like chemotaxis protein
MFIYLFFLIFTAVFAVFHFKITANLRAKINNLTNQSINRGRRISEFAHEIKHPIAIIASTLSAIKVQTKEFLPNADQLCLEQAAEEAHNLADRLQDYLSLCLSESGALRSRPKEVNLYSNVSLVCKLFDNHINECHSKIALDVDKKLMVFVDPLLLKQILFNLIHNSLRHAGDNLEIKISAKTLDQENKILIECADNGSGIKKENQVFSDELVLLKPGHGAGIGLQLCKSLVEFSGGDIWIESQQGQGTKVSFTIPEVTASADTEKFSSVKNVMFVTNGDAKALEIANQVESLGASVEAISDVISALQALSEKDFQAVIIDEHVDHGSGVELARLISEELNLHNTKKFVLLSDDQHDTEIYDLAGSEIWPAKKAIIKELLS